MLRTLDMDIVLITIYVAEEINILVSEIWIASLGAGKHFRYLTIQTYVYSLRS